MILSIFYRKVKEIKPLKVESTPVEKKTKEKETPKEPEESTTPPLTEAPAKRKEEKVSEKSKDSFVKSQNKQKEKPKVRVLFSHL